MIDKKALSASSAEYDRIVREEEAGTLEKTYPVLPDYVPLPTAPDDVVALLIPRTPQKKK